MDFDTGGEKDSQNLSHANASQAFAAQTVNPNNALAAAAAFQQGQHRQQPQQQQQRIIVPHFSLQASSTNPPPMGNIPQGMNILQKQLNSLAAKHNFLVLTTKQQQEHLSALNETLIELANLVQQMSIHNPTLIATHIEEQ
jgi:hypothetical protein